MSAPKWLKDDEVLEGQGSGEAAPWSPRQKTSSPRPGLRQGHGGSPNHREVKPVIQKVETMDKARELFVFCDKEGKGFITKRDMQRLEEELPLSPEQLEVVFDSLDENSHGFLTPVEFNTGLGGLMGLEEITVQSLSKTEEGKEHVDWTQDPSAVTFLNTLLELGADKLFKDHWELCSLWCEVQRERPEFMSILEDILVHAVSHLQDSVRERDSMEKALRRRESEHNKVVRSIYEEMETQLGEQREKRLAQDSVRQWEKGQQLQEELKMREQESERLLARQKELEARIELLNCDQADIKEQNQRLHSLNLHLQEQLETSREKLHTAMAQLNFFQLNTADEQMERQRKVLKVSRNMQKEKESLLRQLELLRDMNKRLHDEKDAHLSQKRNPNVTKPLQRKGSVMAKYFLQDKAMKRQLSSFSQLEQVTGKRKLASSGYEHSRIQPQSNTVSQRLFKVVFLGNSGVGKSSFIEHYCMGHLSRAKTSTVGIDYQMRTLTLGSTTVGLQLWDTAGQERFRSITQQYYRNADGIINMYDITNSSSFIAVRGWMDCVKYMKENVRLSKYNQERTDEGALLMLLGNKLDMADSHGREVTTSEGQRLAEEHKAVFYECSAKTGYNVEELMSHLARMLAAQQSQQREEVLSLTEETTRRGCCK